MAVSKERPLGTTTVPAEQVPATWISHLDQAAYVRVVRLKEEGKPTDASGRETAWDLRGLPTLFLGASF